MKKILICLTLIIFCAGGMVLAQSGDDGKGKNTEKAKIEKTGKEKDMPENAQKAKEVTENKAPKEKAEKVKGKKTEPPEGVQKASEKGKGKKKGLFERWFGDGKEE